jgi:hypothetical protein
MPSSESSQNVSKRHNKNLNSSKTSQQQQQSSESELNKSTSEQLAYQAKTNGDIQPTDSTGLLNLTAVKTLLLVTALTCVCITGFMTRLFSVIRYESIIHEFDPWYTHT